MLKNEKLLSRMLLLLATAGGKNDPWMYVMMSGVNASTQNTFSQEKSAQSLAF
jgi:hypothetical protein